MTSNRRTYADDFKREAVRLWVATDKSAKDVEAELGITPGMLTKWKRQQHTKEAAAFPGRGRLTAEEVKIRQLERELATVRQERETMPP